MAAELCRCTSTSSSMTASRGHVSNWMVPVFVFITSKSSLEWSWCHLGRFGISHGNQEKLNVIISVWSFPTDTFIWFQLLKFCTILTFLFFNFNDGFFIVVLCLLRPVLSDQIMLLTIEKCQFSVKYVTLLTYERSNCILSIIIDSIIFRTYIMAKTKSKSPRNKKRIGSRIIVIFLLWNPDSVNSLLWSHQMKTLRSFTLSSLDKVQFQHYQIDITISWFTNMYKTLIISEKTKDTFDFSLTPIRKLYSREIIPFSYIWTFQCQMVLHYSNKKKQRSIDCYFHSFARQK